MVGEDEKGFMWVLVIVSVVDVSFCVGVDLKERRGFM